MHLSCHARKGHDHAVFIIVNFSHFDFCDNYRGRDIPLYKQGIERVSFGSWFKYCQFDTLARFLTDNIRGIGFIDFVDGSLNGTLVFRFDNSASVR